MSTTTIFKRSGVAFPAPLMLLLSISANAAPRSLGCQINQTDGVSLKTGQSMIENTTARPIAKGTLIEMTVQLAPGTGNTNSVTNRVKAPSILQRHDKISGGDTPKNARSCAATIALIQPGDTTTIVSPVQVK